MKRRLFIIYLIFDLYEKKYKTNIFEPKLEREYLIIFTFSMKKIILINGKVGNFLLH